MKIKILFVLFWIVMIENPNGTITMFKTIAPPKCFLTWTEFKTTDGKLFLCGNNVKWTAREE